MHTHSSTVFELLEHLSTFTSFVQIRSYMLMTRRAPVLAPVSADSIDLATFMCSVLYTGQLVRRRRDQPVDILHMGA